MLVTAEELLKIGIEKKKRKTFKVYVVELDREIECSTLNTGEYFDILCSNKKHMDAEVIYTSCDIFRNDNLIEKLECKFNPIEVVEKILSRGTIFHLTQLILEKSNLKIENFEKYLKDMENDIKN